MAASWQPQGDQSWSGPPRSGGFAQQWAQPSGADVREYLGAIEGAVGSLREELERVRAEASGAVEQAQQAQSVADSARSALEALEGRLAEQDSRLEEQLSRLEAVAATTPQPAEGAAGSDDEPSPVPERPTGSRADDGATDGDPLAGALADFAEELNLAAEARRRGELDVREAFRLLRTGFHKSRRVIGALQRGDRAGAARARRSG